MLVADLRPGPEGSLPVPHAASGGTVLLDADDGTPGSGSRPGEGWAPTLEAGVAFGVTFGLTIVLMMEVGAPVSTPPVGLVSRGLTELIFPVGCAAVIYASDVLGKRL